MLLVRITFQFMFHIFIIVCVVASAVLAKNPDHWRSELFFGQIILSLFIAIRLMKMTNIFAGIGFLALSINAIYCFTYPVSPFAQFGSNIQYRFDAVTAGSYAFMLAIVCPLLIMKRKHIESVTQGFAWICLMNALVVTWNFFFNGIAIGLLDNPAIDATFIAVTYSILCFRPNKIPYDPESPRSVFGFKARFTFDLVATVAPIFAIIVSESSTALVTLIVGWISFLWAKGSLSIRKIGVAFISALSVAAIVIGPSQFLNSNGRFFQWEIALDFWRLNFNPIFGSGIGTYFVFGPHLQHQINPRAQEHYLWLHNEWLQVLFETGFIGLLIAAGIFLSSLRKSFKNRDSWIFAALMALGFSAFTQMPLRLMSFAFLAAFLAFIALRKNNHEHV